MNDVTLALDPFIPWWLVAVFAAAGLTLAVLGIVRGVRASWLRALAVILMAAALLNPALQSEIREPLDGVVAIVTDDSQSQRAAGRAAASAALADTLATRLEGMDGLDVRRVTVSRPAPDQDGTVLFGPLADLLGDVPPDRVAGAILVTDGQVHDAPEALPYGAPVHAIVVGDEDERDRRVEIVAAPRFGLVGSVETIMVRVLDPGAPEGTSVSLTVRADDEVVEERTITVGERVTIAAPIEHGGDNFFQFEVPAEDDELTDVNNTAVAIVEGVRENLRVLLVSGEPHAGERTWRNLLKSDAAVDLVHFTILRPPEKQDGTPINELSLIAFPTRELFSEKIDEFDLIVFDRYHRRNVLPSLYFDNIAQYVLNGGAVLIAAGPDYAGPRSVYHTPLAAALPAAPSGSIIEQPFTPKVSERGERHPVTRDLPGSGEEPEWSDWFRQIEAIPVSGDTVMSGANNGPLLVLAREGEGRVAMMLSDHIWLWARGYEGGGPHVPLMRRLSHWLMQEPELEEEALRLESGPSGLTVERQTLADEIAPIELTGPTGETATIAMEEAAPGLWRAAVEAPDMGLYRATDGTLSALGHVGPANPLEAQDLRSDTELLEPISAATRGSVRRAGLNASPPRVLMRTEGRSMAGRDWIGLKRSEASELLGVERVPLFAGFLGLAVLLLAFSSTWWREGR